MTEHAAQHVDVSNPRLYREDAWAPHFARLRREDPVHRHADSPYGPYWSVTRFADIMKVELDHGTYSSAHSLGGIQIADQPQGQDLPTYCGRCHAENGRLSPRPRFLKTLEDFKKVGYQGDDLIRRMLRY